MATGRNWGPARRLRWLIPVHPHHRRRHRAGPAPPRGVRSRPAGQAGDGYDHRRRRESGDRWRKTVADDGVQTRSVERRRSRPAGAARGITAAWFETRGVAAFVVIARSEATKQSILARGPMDCFAALAMTAEG